MRCSAQYWQSLIQSGDKWESNPQAIGFLNTKYEQFVLIRTLIIGKITEKNNTHTLTLARIQDANNDWRNGIRERAAACPK